MNRGNYASRVGAPQQDTGNDTKLTRNLPPSIELPVFHRAILYVHRDDPHSAEAQAIAPRLLGDFVYVQDVTEFDPQQRPDFLRQTPTLVVYREDSDEYDIYIGREAKQKLRTMNESEPRVAARLAGKFGACAVIPPSYDQIGYGGTSDPTSDRPDPNVDSNDLVEAYKKRRADEDRYLQAKMDRLRAERAASGKGRPNPSGEDGRVPNAAYSFADTACPTMSISRTGAM